MHRDEVWLVFEDVDGRRRYWQPAGRRRAWVCGEAGRAGAARFPDMHAARQAVAASRTQRRRLPRIGYEWLRPGVEQLELIIEGAQQ